MTINELREKRNNAWNAAKAFLDSHRTEKGTLTAEDDATYTRMEQDIADLGKEIARLERQEALEAELSKPVNMPLTSKPSTVTQPDMKTGRASDAYKAGMLTALRSNFKQISNVLQEGVDADGGYLVPDEYDHRLVDVLTEENIMRKLGHKIITSGEHKINIAATKPAAAWIEEGGALSFGDATFDQILLDAHKLHVAIKVTEELLYDNAFNLESYIIDMFGKALANAEEDAFLNGSGAGQPLGLFAATGGGTAAISTAWIMSMIQKIEIDGKQVPFKASAAIPRIYRIKFHRDIYKDLDALGKAVGNGDEGSSHLDMFSLEMFENIAYIMAKHADPTIPDSPEEWLDEFSTFSIYQVLPKIIELWGLNVQTDVESKKNFTQLTGR